MCLPPSRKFYASIFYQKSCVSMDVTFAIYIYISHVLIFRGRHYLRKIKIPCLHGVDLPMLLMISISKTNLTLAIIDNFVHNIPNELEL